MIGQLRGQLVKRDTAQLVVDVNGVALEAALGKYMLFVNNEDKPGFIGSLGATLGEAGVNIANFHLGRTGQGSEAIALLEVDQDIDQPVIKKICDLPMVKQAKALSF